MAVSPIRRLLQIWNKEDENSDISSFKRALGLAGRTELGIILDQDLVLSRTAPRNNRQLIL